MSPKSDLTAENAQKSNETVRDTVSAAELASFGGRFKKSSKKPIFDRDDIEKSSSMHQSEPISSSNTTATDAQLPNIDLENPLLYDIVPKEMLNKVYKDLDKLLTSEFKKFQDKLGPELMAIEERWKSNELKLEARVKELEGLLQDSQRDNERSMKQVADLEARLNSTGKEDKDKTKTGELEKWGL